MTTPHISTVKHGKAERLFKIAQLRIAGMTNQQRIASILGCSQATVSTDFAELDALWRAAAAQDLAMAKGLELERIERLMAAIWPDAIKGSVRAIDEAIKLIELKAKLLGLNAPVTVNLIEVEARRLATEFGLDVSEILAEAQRILRREMPSPSLPSEIDSADTGGGGDAE